MTSKSHSKLAASAVVLGAALLVALPRPAMAQNPVFTNAVPESKAVTVHAKITAIDPQSRAVTLSSASGHQVTVTAGPIVRLEMLKVGDQVNAKYYRSVAFLFAPP